MLTEMFPNLAVFDTWSLNLRSLAPFRMGSVLVDRKKHSQDRKKHSQHRIGSEGRLHFKNPFVAHDEKRVKVVSVQNSVRQQRGQNNCEKRLQLARSFIEMFQEDDKLCSLTMTDKAHLTQIVLWRQTTADFGEWRTPKFSTKRNCIRSAGLGVAKLCLTV